MAGYRPPPSILAYILWSPEGEINKNKKKWQGYSDATWEPEHYLLDESGNDIVPLQKYKILVSAH